MTPTPDTAVAVAEPLQLACFEVHGQLYGVDVTRIREIVRGEVPTPLPNAPALIEGVVEVRGTVVPVVDLGRALGEGAVADGAEGRIAIVECDGLVIGLRVAAAVDVLEVAPEVLLAPPELAARAGYASVNALVHRADAPPVLVLSLSDLLARVQASGPAARGGAPSGADIETAQRAAAQGESA